MKNVQIELSETTRIDHNGNVRTYATLDADALLERLNAGGAEEQEAASRIRELEAQLAEVEARLKDAEAKHKKATALVAKYKEALEVYASEDVWFRCDSTPVNGPKTDFLVYRDGRDINGYEIAQAALSGQEAKDNTESAAGESGE